MLRGRITWIFDGETEIGLIFLDRNRTEEEYSEFVRTEIVVNAATHRDYGIKGTDIQIKMFDDRLEVDSPGTFAGMVKKENIRYSTVIHLF